MPGHCCCHCCYLCCFLVPSQISPPPPLNSRYHSLAPQPRLRASFSLSVHLSLSLFPGFPIPRYTDFSFLLSSFLRSFVSPVSVSNRGYFCFSPLPGFQLSPSSEVPRLGTVPCSSFLLEHMPFKFLFLSSFQLLGRPVRRIPLTWIWMTLVSGITSFAGTTSRGP